MTQVKNSQILKALPARILFPNVNQSMREAFFSSCFSGHINKFEIDGEKKCACYFFLLLLWIGNETIITFKMSLLNLGKWGGMNITQW